MYYLFILLVIVLFYKFYTLKEGYYNSINPCFQKDTPYIKFNDMYVCFDEKNKVEDTIISFYGKEKNCIIDPKRKKISLYGVDGKQTDSIIHKVEIPCKPYKVNIE